VPSVIVMQLCCADIWSPPLLAATVAACNCCCIVCCCSMCLRATRVCAAGCCSRRCRLAQQARETASLASGSLTARNLQASYVKVRAERLLLSSMLALYIAVVYGPSRSYQVGCCNESTAVCVLHNFWRCSMAQAPAETNSMICFAPDYAAMLRHAAPLSSPSADHSIY
jgi:hypothetical protein